MTLREERKVRVFENRVLRGIFGAKRDGVTGDWRKLHNEELNDLGDKTENEMGWACSGDGEKRGVHRVLVRKPEGKKPLGRPRSGWEDNIKMDLQEVVGVVGTGWYCMNFREREYRCLCSYYVINTYAMYELKKNGKVFTSKFVGPRAIVLSQNNLPGRGLTKVEKHWCKRYFQYSYTVEPRLTNLIRSWRPFVNRNVRKPKLS
jgi:hypothetical protein